MCIGGSSADTDRNNTLHAYGDIDNSIATLKGAGSGLRTAGAEDTGAASDRYRDILSGDPAAVASAVAPEANAAQEQAAQQKKVLAMNGNRAGGTNSAMQQADQNVTGKVVDAVTNAQGDAAKGEAAIGQQETGQGLDATKSAANTANDLLTGSADSRKTSQQIHDQAVAQWTEVATALLFGV